MKPMIFFLAVALIAMTCTPSQKENTPEDELSLALRSQYSKELLDSLCKIMIDKNSGAFISVESAKDKLWRYKEFRKQTDCKGSPPYNPKNDVYGFVFGIDKIKRLISKIDSMHAKYGSSTHRDTVIAIRIYMARSI